MIIEGRHAEVGQGIFISDIQEGSAAEKVHKYFRIYTVLSNTTNYYLIFIYVGWTRYRRNDINSQ